MVLRLQKSPRRQRCTWGAFSKRRINMRGFGEAVQRWRAAMAKAARYGGKTLGEDLYLYGGFDLFVAKADSGRILS
jgi:hypothetical protein